MSARQEDEDELPTLEGGEHVFSDEERISISDPFRRQDLQEIVVVDRAVRIEDVFAGHLASVVEDVDFFELCADRLPRGRRHEDREKGRAETSQ